MKHDFEFCCTRTCNQNFPTKNESQLHIGSYYNSIWSKLSIALFYLRNAKYNAHLNL